MRKRSLWVLLAVICLVVLLLPLTTFAAQTDGWVKNRYDEWTYYIDGNLVKSQVIQIEGTYYGFDWKGEMYDDCGFSIGSSYYRAKPGGALYQNAWYHNGLAWYYYGANCKAPAAGFSRVNGSWFYFHSDGRMVCNALVYSDGVYYLLSEDGSQYQAVTKTGLVPAFGKTYCVYESGSQFYLKTSEIVEYDGKKYCTDKYGVVITNSIAKGYDRTLYESITVYATVDGSILRGGWKKVNGTWYYATDDGALYNKGIYTINGNLYYFQDGCLVDYPGEYEYYGSSIYVSTDGGALYRNKWHYRKAGDYPGWVYYDSEGRSVTGVMKIGGFYYYFDHFGVMQTNTVSLSGKVFVFGEDGIGVAKTGWFKNPVSGSWMYANAEGLRVEGPQKINGETYVFSAGGYLLKREVYRRTDYSTGKTTAYLANKEGLLVAKVGWNKVGGEWYYVLNSSGELASGWVEVGKKWYYLDTYSYEMYTNTRFWDEAYESWYRADSNGVCTVAAPPADGLRGLRYYENGTRVEKAWRLVDGNWYYFAEKGYMYQSGTHKIDGIYYVFNYDGTLASGWVKQSGGRTFYAAENGAAYIGLKTIAGKQYYFDEMGYLCHNEDIVLDGKLYRVASDGHVSAVFKQGWNYIRGDWYYLDGKYLKKYLTTIDGVTYGFNANGVMLKDGLYQVNAGSYYLFDKTGEAQTGWNKVDGKWIYADPLTWEVIENGVKTIDGQQYVFRDRFMQTGTVVFDDVLYTTNESGVVVSKKKLPSTGWYYDSVNGRTCYRNSGNDNYTGWVGSYYISNGYMVTNSVVAYDGELYYVGTDGCYVKNGWFKTPEGEYVLAKADGTLYSGEWYKDGAVYYYFDDGIMVRDGFCKIGDEWHIFDADGKWLGVETELKLVEDLNQPDGWKWKNGEWYYYRDGIPVTGEMKIDGVWYGFDYAMGGAMVKDTIYQSHYYGADGARQDLSGWKKVNGEWQFFENGDQNRYGWLKQGDVWYRFQSGIDEKGFDDYEMHMLYDTHAFISGELYYFAPDGHTNGAVSTNGWYLADDVWYYFEDGALVQDGYKVIDGVGYYFTSGAMAANECLMLDDRYVFFDESGAHIKDSGWHSTASGWVYVDQNGYACYEGAYKIDGRIYSFVNGFMVG